MVVVDVVPSVAAAAAGDVDALDGGAAVAGDAAASALVGVCCLCLPFWFLLFSTIFQFNFNPVVVLVNCNGGDT